MSYALLDIITITGEHVWKPGKFKNDENRGNKNTLLSTFQSWVFGTVSSTQTQIEKEQKEYENSISSENDLFEAIRST